MNCGLENPTQLDGRLVPFSFYMIMLLASMTIRPDSKYPLIVSEWGILLWKAALGNDAFLHLVADHIILFL
jgi:hypothetical protein